MLLVAGLSVAASSAAAAVDEVIDGARTSTDPMFPNVGNGGYDALDYDVDIAWTPDAIQAGTYIAGSIEATTTMTAQALQPLKSFSLDFEGLDVDTVTVNGVAAAWSRDIDAGAIKYKLIVTPATPVTGEFTTTVAYSGVPSSHTDLDGSSEGWNRTNDGATMLGQPIGAMTGYPHNNTPADKATYTFTLDIPTILDTVAGTAPGTAAAVSNGELVSKTASADETRTTWVWRQTKPMASELAVISIGRFDVIESQVQLSDGSQIPSWSFMDSALSAANKTTITNRVAQLEAIIQNLETVFGPYPGLSTGVLVDTVPSGINYALETQDRSFFPSTNSVAGNTLIHELVHQWYGNNVAPTTWTDIWIGEGMATWAPTYYNSAEGFGTSATSTELSYYNSWNRTASTSGNWSIAPGAQTDSTDLYGYQTYTRGAQFWQALRIAVGDEAFFETVREWQTRYAGQSKTGADLKALVEEISGLDITDFYQNWILDAGKPSWPDKLDLTLSAAPSDVTLERNDDVSYTLTATNTGLSSLSASVVQVDLSEVLSKAEINTATLAEGVSIDGAILTWSIPETPVTEPIAATSFEVAVSATASGGTLRATSQVASLGGTCVDCVSSLALSEYALEAAQPGISGTAQVAESLVATTDGWPEGTEFEYSWAVDGEASPGSDSHTFVVPESALGSLITVTVTGSKAGYLPSSETSEPVGPVVAAATPTATPTATVPTATPTESETATDSGLAVTGSEAPLAALAWALALVMAGAVGVGAARRRASLMRSDR
ncbi:M1 family metallopeptidase [Microbacterium sp. NPDC076911]|uniref:M1 family metallopeptidase n=1 Tax=Microbacterium sp. NPDC076911 TaxID=3154958 RepID=UPI0034397B7F